MHHRVDPVEPLLARFAQVRGDRLDLQMLERFASPEETVEDDRLVARRDEMVAQDGADIAGSARDQDAHQRGGNWPMTLNAIQDGTACLGSSSFHLSRSAAASL